MKRKNILFSKLPLVQKEKIFKEENNSKKTRIIIIFFIIFISLFLLFCGYSMAKLIGETIINANASIAEPILTVENNPEIDITAYKNYGTYSFKVKNYNSEEKITETNLKYYIEILSNLDDSIINVELFENGNKINLTNNRSEYIEVSNKEKHEKDYEVKVTYNNDAVVNIGDILEKIEVKVHTEQVKA